MAASSSSCSGYLQTLTLTYPDGFSFTATFDLPTVNAIQNGDEQLLDRIRKNYMKSLVTDENGNNLSRSSCTSTEFEPSSPVGDTETDFQAEDCQVSGESQSKDLFRKEHVLFIIEKYKLMKEKFDDPKIKKKCLWESLKEDLNTTFTTQFTREQVEGRWKSLLARYRRVKSLNDQSGNGRKDFVYEKKLDEILKERHDIFPVSLIGSMKEVTEADLPDSVEITAGKKRKIMGMDAQEPSEKKRKKTSSPNTVIKFLQSFAKEMNDKQEETLNRFQKMHDEKMGIFRGILDVMKK